MDGIDGDEIVSGGFNENIGRGVCKAEEDNANTVTERRFNQNIYCCVCTSQFLVP